MRWSGPGIQPDLPSLDDYRNSGLAAQRERYINLSANAT
jgi:hypothetical protein